LHPVHCAFDAILEIKEEIMKLLSRSMGAVLLLAGSLPVAAEQAPQQVQVFGESIDVRVVNVEAVVVDRKGERVRGLSAADFRLLVDGKEVPIEYCTEIEEGKAASSTKESAGAPVAAGEPEGELQPGEQVEVLPTPPFEVGVHAVHRHEVLAGEQDQAGAAAAAVAEPHAVGLQPHLAVARSDQLDDVGDLA